MHENRVGRTEAAREHRGSTSDFADLDGAFFEDALVLPSYKRRRRGIGKYLDGMIAVIFATLGTEAVSIISMRPASKKERQLYAEP
jgi:uncharacterized DUF497 family protein